MSLMVVVPRQYLLQRTVVAKLKPFWLLFSYLVSLASKVLVSPVSKFWFRSNQASDKAPQVGFLLQVDKPTLTFPRQASTPSPISSY